jgi:prophage tail gpP-like protein
VPDVRETVRVVIGGKTFTDWKTVHVSAAKNESARSFTLDVAERAIGVMAGPADAEWVCQPG